MKLVIKNAVYRSLALAGVLSALGSYLYNIVFVVYAASLPQASLAVSLANIITVLPTLLTFWVGIRADATRKKSLWLVRLGFIQALFFSLVALVINQRTYLVFGLVSLVNVLSDALADFGNGLRLPLIQRFVAQKDLMAAYGFSQGLTYLCQLLGQALGVWLLAFSEQNFALVAWLNALSFLSASLVLWSKRAIYVAENLVGLEKISLKNRLSGLLGQLDFGLSQLEKTSLVRIFVAVTCLNGLSGGITAIYSLALLQQPISGLSYGQSLVVVEGILVLGIMAGSFLSRDWLASWSLRQLLAWDALLFALVGVSNLLTRQLVWSLLPLFLAAYSVGKVNPKLNSILLTSLPADVLAQTSSLLSLLATVSIPLGTSLFSFLALYQPTLAWLVLVGVGFGVLFLMRGQTWYNRCKRGQT